MQTSVKHERVTGTSSWPAVFHLRNLQLSLCNNIFKRWLLTIFKESP